ncbi:MAG TPA: Mur ligase family protein [Phenylobacterium sp.]|nr:Mur ligase family protein [Phenylobacterium sp.]
MRIHFTGLAGAGMSAAALTMREAGHEVSGSDEDVFPPMSTYVAGLGFPFHRRFDAANLPADLDLLVLGASAKLGGEANVEVAEARRRGVRVTSFPELVGEATEGRANTVVAGSFGKSTCTALIAHVLRQAGHDAGWMVGAISPSLPDTGHWGTAPEMVLEGDEYIVGPDDRRSKFLLYHPRDVLLTSLAHDHVNVFPTFAEYEAPFRKLLELLPDEGLLMAREHPAIRAIADAARCRIVWYDTGRCEGWWADEVSFGDVSRFTLVRPDGGRIPLSTSLLGEHNVENIVGVSAYLLERGLVSEAALVAGIASFAGIRRRLDRLTKRSAVPVIEGFGSSYEKARSAIEALLLHYPHRPLTVVFEPHTFSWRSKDALSWYDTVFEGAARVLIVPPPTHGAASHHQSSFEEILARAAATGVPVEGVRTAEAATRALSALKGDEVVLLLSSGPLLGLPDSLPPVFDALSGDAAFLPREAAGGGPSAERSEEPMVEGANPTLDA